YRRWASYLQDISDAVMRVAGVRTTMHKPEGASPFPTMIIEWDPAQVGITAGDVYRQLLDGEPRIMSHATGDGYSFNVRPPSIRPGDPHLARPGSAGGLRPARKGGPDKPVGQGSGHVGRRCDPEVRYSGSRPRDDPSVRGFDSRLGGARPGGGLGD